MSDELSRYGAGVEVADHDPAAIAAAVRAVRLTYARLAPKAAAGRTACLQRHSPKALIQQIVSGAAAGPPRRVAVLYPWGDYLEQRAGASVRTNLLVRKLAPLVDEIRVLQSGRPSPLPPFATILRRSLALPLLALLSLISVPFAVARLTRTAFGRLEGAPPVHFGNVTVEAAPVRLRQRVVLRAFRAAFRLLVRQGPPDQEMMLWFFLERRLDPRFVTRVRELVSWADVVFLEYPFWASIVAPVCAALGKTLIITDHDVLAQQVATPWLRRWTGRLECEGLGSGTHAVCVSESDRAWFAANGVNAQVISNPVDRERFEEPIHADVRLLLRELYDVAIPPGPVCLFVGSNFGPNIEAAEQLKGIAARMPQAGPIAFVIAGACAPPASGANWICLGRIEDATLALLYQLAALILVPLRYGTGSSVKTIEALAAGRPVLGTSTAFRGLDLHQEQGCIHHDDLNEWPAVIAGLLASPARLMSLGAAARRASAAFDYRVLFEPYLGLAGIQSAQIVAAEPIRTAVIARAVMERAIARKKLELAATVLEGSAIQGDPDDVTLLRTMFSESLKTGVLTAASDGLSHLGAAPESEVLRSMVLLAADEGRTDLADAFLRHHFGDRRTGYADPADLRRLDAAMKAGDFEKARLLLRRMKPKDEPMRDVGG